MAKITVKHIAEQTGVSVATVSRALNNSGYVHTDVRARIEATMQRLGYVPNMAARNLATGRTRTVGLVLQTLHSPAFVEMTEAIQLTLREKGYFLLMCNSQFNKQIELDYLQLVQRGMLDGIITNATNDTESQLRQLVQGNYPIVFINRSLNGHNALEYRTGFVQVDLQHATFLATDHLLSLGHRCIGVVTGEMTLSTQHRRLEGYRQALQKYAVAFNPKLICAVGATAVGAADAEMKTHSLHNVTMGAVENMIASQPNLTAFIVVYHTQLPAVMQAIQNKKKCVPDDLSLVAFSDFSLAPFMCPPLTVVAQPSAEMGKYAADMLISLIEHVPASEQAQIEQIEHTQADVSFLRQILLKPSLIVRESCRSVNL
jgi:LacI family transcriptional regulator